MIKKLLANNLAPTWPEDEQNSKLFILCKKILLMRPSNGVTLLKFVGTRYNITILLFYIVIHVNDIFSGVLGVLLGISSFQTPWIGYL